MSERTGDALILALVILLPLSALLARRLPVARVVRYALAWVAIFAIATALILLYQRRAT